MKKGLLTLIVTAVVGGIGGSAAGIKLSNKTIGPIKKDVEKFKSYYSMLNQWLALKQQGKTLEKYFIDNNYKTIAIYGMGEMGKRLYDELKDTSIKVKYAIDKEASSIYSELEVVDKDERFEEVDAIVITATFAYSEIERELREKINFSIISLDDVVYES